MAEKILFNIAESVLKNLGSRALDEIASAWGFKARLEKLKNTICTIKDVLLDAEDRQVESHAVRGWLERLTVAVYAADDLFDEFATVASRKEIMGGSKLSKEVKVFFSDSNQIAFAFNISQKIKKIREELDEIVKDSTEFAFVLRPREEGRGAGKQLRDQTHSFVDAEDVIGRDDDKKAILNILLASGSAEDQRVCVVPIVGIGGLGKTTLAQLIYNDDQVKQFELRLWVCVSDVFDIERIIKKILVSATNNETQKLEIDQLQGQLQKEIGGKKYFLVLDDVWNENREEWLKLSALLKLGREGSKILVTTRSREVASVMGTVPPYDLGGLSEEKSWALFEKMAFESGEAQKKPHLAKMGKEIVKKCAAVPLAIRTLGSLLHGKSESKWLSVKDTSLAKVADSQNNVMAILKLSYHHLWSPLKNCFAYCALFPKDYEIEREELIDLWMAEGFIIPANESQSLEDLADEYFMLLLQRCFFQDITKDEWGNITSCKMHDLMHDLALEVAGTESKLAKFEDKDFSQRVHHLSFDYRLTSSWKIPSYMLDMKQLRTFLLPEQVADGSDFKGPLLQQLISNFRSLRTLDLQKLGVRTLPQSIDKLIHLRYLNLSSNPIKELPCSILELQNLQTMKLRNCNKLTTLPVNIRNLTSLRSLDLFGCDDLTHMPPKIGELTCLHKLNLFMVKHEGPPKSRSKPTTTAELRDLKTLNNLRGALTIRIFQELTDPVSEANEANLNRKNGLGELCIQMVPWSYGDGDGDDGRSNHDEGVLEGLKPHPNLKKLVIRYYRGQKLPSWAMSDNLCTTLPNLVEIQLLNCGRCRQLPSFSQLPSLKHLSVLALQSVEYMESGVCTIQGSSSSTPTQTLFFPSLLELTLCFMGNLKCWWKETEAIPSNDQQEISHQSGQHLLSMSFSNLRKLRVRYCLNLTSLPLCPNIEELDLKYVNKNLLVLEKLTESVVSSNVGSSATLPGFSSKLKSLTNDYIEDLLSLPEECLRTLSSLEIQDSKLVNTSKLGDVFKHTSSLNRLRFTKCDSLRSISEGLEHLIALEKLDIWFCEELDLSENEQLEDGMPWKALKRLRSLHFFGNRKLVHLPTGLQHLTNLRSLEIARNDNLIQVPEWISCFSSLEYLELRGCPKLTSLPEELGKLTSLRQLRINGCPGLTERCRGPAGEDWPKIQHIPLVSVFD